MTTSRTRCYFEVGDGVVKAAENEIELVSEGDQIAGKRSKELMIKYGGESTVAENNVEKMVERVALQLVGMVIYISRAILKRYSKEISGRDYFG